MPKKKRLRLRYSLMTLFVITSVACAALAYYQHRARQTAALAILCNDNPDRCIYEYEFGEDGKRTDAVPGVPRFLLNWLGKDFFYDVAWVSVNIDDLREGDKEEEWIKIPDDQILHQLRNVSGLRRLKVQGRLSEAGMNKITEVESLSHLEFSHCDVSTPQALTVVRNLPLVHLRLDHLTFESADGLGNSVAELTGLQSLQIRGNQVNQEDFAALAGLQHLTELKLTAAQFGWLSPEEIETLGRFPALVSLELPATLTLAQHESALPVLNRNETLRTIYVPDWKYYLTPEEGDIWREEIRTALASKHVEFLD